MKWIKCSERLPVKRPERYFVKYGSNSMGTLHVGSFNKWNVIEWLDESVALPAAPEHGQREVYVPIPVSERLPVKDKGYETSKMVIGIDEHGIERFCYYNYSFNKWRTENADTLNITHWLELQTQAPALPVPDAASHDKEVAALAFDAGYNYGVDQQNVLTKDGQIYPDKKTYLNSLK